MTQVRITKRLSMKGATLEGNTLLGGAAAIGNLDRGADVIFPGFFDGVTESFLENGFVPTDHAWEWNSLVAMPTVAKEVGNRLQVEAVFHGTPDAQAVKQKCQERLDNKLSVGLSIAFSLEVDGYKWFASGADLLDYAKKNGYDLKLFDVATIKAWTGPCRALLQCAELFEFSIVPVPMNPQATMTGTKRFYTAEELPGVLSSLLAAGAEIMLSDGTLIGVQGGKSFEEAAVANAAAVAAAAAQMNSDADQNNADADKSASITELEAKQDGDKLTFKSVYLGENIEVYMTMEAVYELTWTMYSVVYQSLFGSWGYDDETDEYMRIVPDLDTALETIEGAAQEYGQILLRIIKAIMSTTDGAQTTEDAEKALTVLTGSKNAFSLLDNLPAGKSFAMQLKTVLAAVKSCIGRGQAIAGLRLKEGRMLSQENREKLSAHRDALQECLGNVDEMLAASEPKASPSALRKARLNALRWQASPFLDNADLGNTDVLAPAD